MAFGYPASPDHSLKREAFDLLAVEVTTGMRLTENWMIDPGEALCGLMLVRRRLFLRRDHRHQTAARLCRPPRPGGRTDQETYPRTTSHHHERRVEIINEAVATERTRFALRTAPAAQGDGMQKIFAAMEPLMDFDPAYINITFHREGIKETVREDGSVEWHVVRRRPGTVGISAAIQHRYGVEVVPHLICGGSRSTTSRTR